MTDPTIVETEPNIGKPANLAAITPTPLNVPVMRIANNTGTSTSPVSGTWASMVYHTYSKQEPWNADESLINVENGGGSPSHLLLNGTTYVPVSTFCGGYSYYDFRWHPVLAHKNEQINVTQAGMELMWFDVVGCTKTRTWTLPAAASYGIGSGEGNPSNDGRFVAINTPTSIYVVDMDPQPPLQTYAQGNRRIGPALNISSCGLANCTIDNATISPLGNYVVVNYQGDNERVFDVNPTTLALTPHAISTSFRAQGCSAGGSTCCEGTGANGYIYSLGHADYAVDPFDNNEEVAVGQDGCHVSGSTVGGVLVGHVMKVRLRDGTITALTSPSNEAYAHHISTRNINRPGWAYVSYFPGDGKRFGDEVMAVKLDGSKAVQRFAHAHSAFGPDQGVSPECYHCEVHVAPSPDGRRMLITSDWAEHCGSGCTDQFCTAPGCGTASDVKTYVIDARGD